MINPFDWVLRRWRAHQRSIDMAILWPTCLAQAKDLDFAKAAFAIHAFNDRAWTADMTEDEITEFIDRLEVYD